MFPIQNNPKNLDLSCKMDLDFFWIVFLGGGWSGGAKVLGKLQVLGRPTNLDYSRAGAYCACSRCG